MVSLSTSSSRRMQMRLTNFYSASHDNVRLYDMQSTTSTLPFLIVPGHHGGTISSWYVDPTCRYAISASGNRGWDGVSTEVVLVYEVGIPRWKRTA